jgi:hypothetical protein
MAAPAETTYTIQGLGFGSDQAQSGVVFTQDGEEYEPDAIISWADDAVTVTLANDHPNGPQTVRIDVWNGFALIPTNEQPVTIEEEEEGPGG